MKLVPTVTPLLGASTYQEDISRSVIDLTCHPLPVSPNYLSSPRYTFPDNILTCTPDTCSRGSATQTGCPLTSIIFVESSQCVSELETSAAFLVCHCQLMPVLDAGNFQCCAILRGISKNGDDGYERQINKNFSKWGSYTWISAQLWSHSFLLRVRRKLLYQSLVPVSFACYLSVSCMTGLLGTESRERTKMGI